MRPAGLDEALAELDVPADYAAAALRLIEAAGARAADAAQTFLCEYLIARERGASDPGATSLASVRRYLRHERILDAQPRLMLVDDAGRERERAELVQAPSAGAPALPDSDVLMTALHILPPAERRAIRELYFPPKRRGRRSREVLALAERGLARLKQAFSLEQDTAKLFACRR